MEDIKALGTAIAQDIDEAKTAGTSQAYAKLAQQLADGEVRLREHAQAMTQEAIRALMKKLETTKPLTAEELALVRLWVVGDAEQYVSVENNAGDWFNDLARIAQEVGRESAASLDAQAVFRLRALLHDGKRTAWDLQHYLEQKERLQVFQEASRELDPEEREILLDVLKHQLKSKEM